MTPNDYASRTARWSVLGTIAFFVLLTVLHFLKPEISPSWRFISEYAIGEHGWLMSVAFVSFAIAYVALSISLWNFASSIAGRTGLLLLLISAAGLVLAGLFTTDPVTTPPQERTTAGKLHNLGGALGMAMPFAAVFVSWSLGRHPAWRWARARLWGSASLALLGFIGAMSTLGILLSRSDGRFGPDVPIGWPNRLEVLGYGIWVTVVALTLMRGERAAASSTAFENSQFPLGDPS